MPLSHFWLNHFPTKLLTHRVSYHHSNSCAGMAGYREREDEDTEKPKLHNGALRESSRHHRPHPIRTAWGLHLVSPSVRRGGGWYLLLHICRQNYGNRRSKNKDPAPVFIWLTWGLSTHFFLFFFLFVSRDLGEDTFVFRWRYPVA
jgi:hypothetical protein